MLSGDTEILTPDGWQEIAGIKDGDRVLTHTREIVQVRVSISFHNQDAVRLYAKDCFLSAMPWQHFLTVRGWQLASSLVAGDRLVGIAGETELEDVWSSEERGAFYQLSAPTYATQLGAVMPSGFPRNPLKIK